MNEGESSNIQPIKAFRVRWCGGMWPHMQKIKHGFNLTFPPFSTKWVLNIVLFSKSHLLITVKTSWTSEYYFIIYLIPHMSPAHLPNTVVLNETLLCILVWAERALHEGRNGCGRRYTRTLRYDTKFFFFYPFTAQITHPWSFFTPSLFSTDIHGLFF